MVKIIKYKAGGYLKKVMKEMQKSKDFDKKHIKQQKFDDIKHFLRRAEGFCEAVALTMVYYLIWKYCYRQTGMVPYYGYGKIILLGVYFALLIVIFILCDSFKFGHLKLIDVLISQWISLLIVNIITYFQLCLIANHILNPLGMFVLTGIDIVLSLICTYIFTAIYHNKYVPKNMVMIYGNKNAVSLKFKMDMRVDKYHVSEIINIDKGIEFIKNEILKHDAVIINDVSAQIRNDVVKFCYMNGVRTYVVPKISDIIIRGAEDLTLFDTPLILVKGRGLTFMQRLAKRILDIVLCLTAMVPCAPIMIIVALAIKIEDRGPIFYKQKRVTIGGREFDILKFRSMIVDAEKGGYDLSMRASGRDPRITKVGNIIRACRIDELPQILNILKGDMSIVGPRPERIENVEEYSKEIPEFIYRTKVKGGLTGYAQIYGKYNTSAYDKLRLDLMYIENYSFLTDIKLIFMTLQILVKPESTEGFDKAEELEQKKEELLSYEKNK